jgi:hypothetical protein
MLTKRQRRLKARELKLQGWKNIDIAEELGVTAGTVSNWTSDIKLTPEQEEAMAIENPTWLKRYKYGQKIRQTALDKRMLYQDAGREKAREGSLLHLMATMLYWGEGTKARSDLSLINSDPYMLKLFIRFLRIEMAVPDDKIRISIQHHTTDEKDIARIIQYWLEWLELPLSTTVSTQLKIGTSSRKKRYINGFCTISVGSVEIVQQIFGAIQEYIGIDKPQWGK